MARAVITAIDSSAEMVAAARERGVAAELGDVREWMPGPDTDVVVTNAVLHWVPEHPQLLRRWVAALPGGAWFAMQVPGNFAAPSHALVRELAAEPPWSQLVDFDDSNVVLEPAEYGELLATAGAEVDVWETTYLHRLTGPDPVLRWISATTLRPIRDALDEAAYTEFCNALAPRLREAYPPGPDGTTWFPFRRIFAVAHVR